MILGLAVLSSHPPLFGFASSLTLIGFTFGMWPGALIGIMGSMCGSGLAFWSIRVCRRCILNRRLFVCDR